MSTNSRHYFRYFTYVEPVLKIPVIKNYGSSILTFVAMSVFILFAIKPTIETIVVLQKKLEDSKGILTQVKQKSENLSLAIENYNALDDVIKIKISEAVPANIQLKTLSQTLESAALSNQATISALQIQPIDIESKITDPTLLKKPVLSEIQFTFNLSGTYESLRKTLEALNTGKRLVSIESITFNKSEDQALFMLITGKAYFLK